MLANSRMHSAAFRAPSLSVQPIPVLLDQAPATLAVVEEDSPAEGVEAEVAVVGKPQDELVVRVSLCYNY